VIDALSLIFSQMTIGNKKYVFAAKQVLPLLVNDQGKSSNLHNNQQQDVSEVKLQI
jgi:hypothetical protein